jgi:hypothetical protein
MLFCLTRAFGHDSTFVQVKKPMCMMWHVRSCLLVTTGNGCLVGTDEECTLPRVDRVLLPISACIRQRGVKECAVVGSEGSHDDITSYKQGR